MPGFDEDFKGHQLDVAKAKELLAAAGHKDGAGLPPIKLYYRADRQDAEILCTMVQQDLRQNLGVKVDLAPTEWKALLEMRNRGQLGFFHLRWGADYLDPQNYLSFMLHTNARENTLGYSNADVAAGRANCDVPPGGASRRERRDLDSDVFPARYRTRSAGSDRLASVGNGAAPAFND
jgi:ABC-type transport system substrate-binding protein